MTTSIVIGRDSTDKGQDCLGILGLAKNSNCTAFTVCFELSAGERGHSLPAFPGAHWNSELSLSVSAREGIRFQHPLGSTGTACCPCLDIHISAVCGQPSVTTQLNDDHIVIFVSERVC